MNMPFDMNTTERIELHETLQDLLAGYVDNELDDEQTTLVEAHLIGCKACRNDLQRQQALSHCLESMPGARLPGSAHQKIDTALESAAVEKVPSVTLPFWLSSTITFLKSRVLNFRLASLVGASGWGVALLLAIIIIEPHFNNASTRSIPMIQDALAEYYEMESKVLPASDTTNKAIIKAPLSWPNAQLLSSWETRIAGAPAQVFALRSGHNIIFQYQVSEAVFFRNPVVRKAISKTGSYAVRDNKTDVLAIPFTDSGVLVVGATDSLPKPEQLVF